MGDLGYQGYQPDHLTLTLPFKKPKNAELTAEEKEGNTALARIRVYVEHAIRGMKIYQITSTTFRNKTAGMVDQVMEIAAGLYTLKCRWRDQAPSPHEYSGGLQEESANSPRINPGKV